MFFRWRYNMLAYDEFYFKQPLQRVKSGVDTLCILCRETFRRLLILQLLGLGEINYAFALLLNTVIDFVKPTERFMRVTELAPIMRYADKFAEGERSIVFFNKILRLFASILLANSHTVN